MKIPTERHQTEMIRNMSKWDKKPILRSAYRRLYGEMIRWIRPEISGKVVEIGSGIGNFKTAYPECIATDIFPNEWIDQIESAYRLSFQANSVSHLILFDVLHHLKFPGSALSEFKRVTNKGGRIIICDPYISVFGLFVYGIFHHEPVNSLKKIQWMCPPGINPDAEYYAAQGNTTRMFSRYSKFRRLIEDEWNIILIKRMSAISYVLSGGFSKPTLYFKSALPLIICIEKILDFLPSVFATRVMVVLERK